MVFDINDPNPSSEQSISHLASLSGQHLAHPAIILKRTLYDGNVKIFEDAKGIAQRTEILVSEGKIVVYKDYEVSEKLAKYKKIDVFSIEDELRGTIDIIARDRTSPNPSYRFFYEGGEIGAGSGDLALFIAQKFLGENIASRSGIGTYLDEEVILTIKKIFQNKSR